MKRTFILFSFVYFTSLAIFSQSLTLSDDHGALPNGTTKLVVGDTNTAIEAHVKVNNISGSAKDVKVKKTEITVVPGSINYFCWTSCYDPSVMVSPSAITIAAGSFSTDFVGDYFPMGHIGTTEIRYTFFDANNTTDSVCIHIQYQGIPQAIKPFDNKTIKLSNAFPNPARNFVSFDYAVPGNQTGAKLIIRDLLGAKVSETEVNGTEGRIVINTESFKEGIYFYSFIVDNQVLTTRKLVIGR